MLKCTVIKFATLHTSVDRSKYVYMYMNYLAVCLSSSTSTSVQLISCSPVTVISYKKIDMYYYKVSHFAQKPKHLLV